ncbi:amidohydrolase family protein [Rhodocytophaga aerolata]|uniref:Amidohydrolase family protein n=1 Tax=Rhodocytophaga aerolata TaxID=455078 RepID=A0ABT8RA03_9BACT|nr:amidohydrolase family protein [Rhodocytophaga aerolata]MDO1448912.1 amidohydrolase family protein [Rhodocytophaga aerolata]
MKIDAHQHFWHYSPQDFTWITEDMSMIRRNFLPQDLLPELEKANYHGCVAIQAAQSEDETRFLLSEAEAHPFVKGVVGWVDLQSIQVDDRLAVFASSGRLVGVRHVVQSEPDDQFMLRPTFLNGIKLLEKYNLAYDILIHPKHLPVAVQFVKKNPNQRFVLDHLAKPYIKDNLLEPWSSHLHALATYDNVYCKLSGLVTEADWYNWAPEDFIPYLEVALDAFGTNRLMVGSDWPVCTLAANYEEVMQIVEDYVSDLSTNEQARILGLNAVDFYRLK